MCQSWVKQHHSEKTCFCTDRLIKTSCCYRSTRVTNKEAKHIVTVQEYGQHKPYGKREFSQQRVLPTIFFIRVHEATESPGPKRSNEQEGREQLGETQTSNVCVLERNICAHKISAGVKTLLRVCVSRETPAASTS